MMPVYFRELKPYPKEDIKKLIKNDIFEKLLESKHLSVENDKCKFDFVGIILLNDHIIRCYPKYMHKESKLDEDYNESTDKNFKETIEKDFNDVMRSIKKYKKQHEPFQYENEFLEDVPFNLLSLMLFFIEDYYENGAYSNIRNILEINGNGAINWDKTINDSFPLIKNKRPYYMELYTRHKLDDLYNYFRLLHECIITECSKRLEEVGLLEIFDLPPVELSDVELKDFDDEFFILNKLEKELNLEFNTHKQKLLKSMHAYVSKENSFNNENFLTLYGANSYEYVWENMCAEVFNNKLETNIGKLGLEFKYGCDFNPDVRLIEIVEKPNWVFYEGTSIEKSTLRPDIITFYEDNFIIFDAKYYDLSFEGDNDFKGPGIDDVTKQYLYQLAYKKFIKRAKFKGVKNAFLMPTFDSKVKNMGYVELNMLHKLCTGSPKMQLENIQIILLPARKINELYLNNEDMEDLEFLFHKTK